VGIGKGNQEEEKLPNLGKLLLGRVRGQMTSRDNTQGEGRRVPIYRESVERKRKEGRTEINENRRKNNPQETQQRHY